MYLVFILVDFFAVSVLVHVTFFRKFQISPLTYRYPVLQERLKLIKTELQLRFF